MTDIQMLAGEEYLPDVVTENDGVAEPRKRGFANPETLAKAQATRKENKDNAPVSSAFAGDGVEPKKRGRKPGSTNEKKRDLDGIKTLLVGIHQMLSVATGFSSLAIDDSEGAILADAIAKVGDEYKIKVDGKTGAFLTLAYALAVVYGPRIFVIRQEIMARNAQHGSAAATQ
jgi:hypothetical protein